MNNNMITLNQHLFDAYSYFQQGKIEQSLEEYHKSLKYTYNNQLKNNIKCTIAILAHHAEQQESSLTYLENIVQNQNQQSQIVVVRTLVNLILIQILEGKLTNALDYFQNLMEIIQKEQSLYQKKQILQFTTFLFFRVKNLQDIGEYIQNMDLSGLKIEEINSMSLMAFNSEICKLQTQQKIQKKCYQEFLKNKRYDLAIFSLRSLIKFTKNSTNKRVYQKQLGQLIMLGYFSQQINFNNYQLYDVMQAMIEQFIKFRNKINEEIRILEMKNGLSEKNSVKYNEIPDKQLAIQWKFTLNLMFKEVWKMKEIDQEKKKSILKILSQVKDEKNILVIRAMTKNNYFCKYHEKVQQIIKGLSNMLKSGSKIIMQDAFLLIKNSQVLPLSETMTNKENSARSKLILKSQKSRNDKSFHNNNSKMKQQSQKDKQNNHQLGISIVSVASSKISNRQTHRRKIFEDQGIIFTAKRIQKMIKMLEYGCFLNKRNFNSEGGQYKYVKINNSFIKWAKDPEKISSNCQVYPLHDIKSIIYGRVSKNLNENSNKMLSYSKCFTLLLQKRTLDFYCKNYEELEGWVCGLTAVLKKQKCKIVGYTPGKLRWKKMFAILKEHFIEPLRTNQKKYYYQNAHSVILFAKNGYKLPKKSQK